MSMSTKLGAYPAEFMEWTSQPSNVAFSVECDGSEKAANGIRMQWYGFLRALDGRAKNETPVRDEHGAITYPWDTLASSARQYKVTVAGSTVTFTPREQTRVGEFVRRLGEDKEQKEEEFEQMVMDAAKNTSG